MRPVVMEGGEGMVVRQGGNNRGLVGRQRCCELGQVWGVLGGFDDVRQG